MRKNYFICLMAVAMMCLTVQSRAAIVMIEVEDFEFDPAVFNVNVGDTIMWMWDEGFHTATSTSIPAGATAWDASISSTSPVFIYLVTTPGSYDYQCSFHASMGMLGHFTVSGTTTWIDEPAPSLSFVSNYLSNGQLNINYSLPYSSLLHINLYDVIGNKVQTFLSSTQVSGKHSETYNVAEFPKGIYIVELATDNSRVSKRIMIQ